LVFWEKEEKEERREGLAQIPWLVALTEIMQERKEENGRRREGDMRPQNKTSARAAATHSDKQLSSN